MFVSVRDVSPISYKIGQKMENSRLMRGHTQIELASKIVTLPRKSRQKVKTFLL
ncbi:hypothetical protein [Wolbachia endosymbiont of Laodelphax striatellus]|uniref:hypothetical protein n=1 Tax=Wolbachia endosymbiont of Laodelphax striatellus TaxID=368602 RepID=UPI000AD747F7|nr:hypothetical protein [Wolbachia endosymbiont of Laodelphax striatellus]